MSIYDRKSINGSVKWLGVPHPPCNDGLPCTDNLLCPSPRWLDGVRVGAWDWWIQPDVRFGGFDVLWRGAVPACAAYLPGSPENVRATARRVRDALLWEHRPARAPNLLNSRHMVGDELVNCTDGNWGWSLGRTG